MLYEAPVTTVIQHVYDNKTWATIGYCLHRKITPKDTVCIIMRDYQKVYFDWLCAQPNVNILFVGPAAVNKTSGHGTEGRNCLVIFELNEEIPAV